VRSTAIKLSFAYLPNDAESRRLITLALPADKQTEPR
jgi:hypothetical protein